MSGFELLWWVGWAYAAAWAALPLALLHWLGPWPVAVLWALLAPWTTLFGLAIAHRLLPPVVPGTYRMFRDPGSVHWAMRTWAPSVAMTLLQPLFFLSRTFSGIALRALGATLGEGAWVTSRTILHEPHLVRLGRGAVAGEYSHFITSYQVRPGLLVVGSIEIGDDAMIAGYVRLGAGARIGARTIVEYDASVGPRVSVGEDSRIGGQAVLYTGCTIGSRVRLGKGCSVLAHAVVPDDTRVPDNTVWDAGA